MRPVNALEDLVEIVVKELLDTNQNLMGCTCPQCVNDVIALTLNKLPSRYISRSHGWNKVVESFDSAYTRDEIKREITRSMIIISQNPSHD